MNLGDLTLNIVLSAANAGTVTAQVSTGLTNVEGEMKKVTSESNILKSALGSTGSSFSNVTSGLAKFGLAMTGIQAIFGMLKSTLGDFVRESQESEIASAKLANGLSNVGESGDAIRRLSNQASELSKITPFDDDDIVNAQAMLTTFMKSSEEISILTPRLLDLSAAYMKSGDSSMDLQRIAVMLGKVNEETIGGLRRVGVEFSKEQEEILKSLTGVEQASYLATILDQNFKGMAVTVGQTSAGQIKIMNTELRNLKESLGSIISGAIVPLLIPIRNLLNVLNSAPNSFKTAALAVAALGVALQTLGRNMSIETKAFMLIAALMQALPPNLRIATGAVFLLAGAFLALNGSLTIMNISLGGLPMILGLVATGVVGILSGFSSEKGKDSFDQLSESIGKTNDAISSADANINNLKSIQQGLSAQSTLSAAEQESLNQKISDAIHLYPQLITGVDEHTGALQTNSTSLKEVIQNEEDLNAIRREKLIADQVKQINDLVVAHGEDIEKLKDYKARAEELNNILTNQEKLNKAIASGLSITYLQDELEGVNEEMINTASATADVAANLNKDVEQGIKFGDLKEVIARLKPALENNSTASETFFRILSIQLGMAITGWDNLNQKVDEYNAKKFVGPIAPTQDHTPDKLQEQISAKDKEIGTTSDKLKIKELQKEKANLEKERKDLLGETDNKSVRRSSPRLAKTEVEKDPVDELIISYNRLIDIYHTADDAKKETGASELEVIAMINNEISKTIYSQDQLIKLDKKRKELWSESEFSQRTTASTEDPLLQQVKADVESARALYNEKTKYGTDKRYNAFDEIEEYRKALELRKKLLDIKLTEKDYDLLIKDAQEKINNLDKTNYEDVKKIASLKDDIKNYEKEITDIIDKRNAINNDIHSKEIELINDEFLKRKAKIEQEYQLELERLKKLDASPRQKQDFTRLASDTRDINLKANDEERRQKISDLTRDAFNQSLEIADAISSQLGEGASKVLSAFRQAYSFVTMIVELLKTIQMATSLLNFIPGFGALKGIGGGAGIGGAGAALPDMLNTPISSSQGALYMPLGSYSQRQSITIIPQGELSDHLTYKIVSRGTVINNVKIARATV